MARSKKVDLRASIMAEQSSFGFELYG